MKTSSFRLLIILVLTHSIGLLSCKSGKESNLEISGKSNCPRVAALKEQNAEPIYKVSTYAGANEESNEVVNGVLCKARFNSVTGIVTTPDGTQYVADAGNGNIRKISSEGIVSTFVGSPIGGDFDHGFVDGNGTEARFSSPLKEVISSDGTLIVLDQGKGALRKVTPLGQVTTYLDELLPDENPYRDGPLEEADFGRLDAIAESPTGELYIMDGYNTIRKISKTNIVSTYAGQRPLNGTARFGYKDGQKENALFQRVTDIEFGKDGSLYFCDQGNKKIRKITSDGNVSTVADLEATRLVVDTDGTIYAANISIIYRIGTEGHITPIAGSTTTGYKDGIGLAARFRSIVQMALHSGKLFVGDGTMVRKISIK